MTISNNMFFLDVFCNQINHVGELICGDKFLSRRVKEDGRTIIVLSDGMGSGVKANVLATLTASMAMNFTIDQKDLQETAEIIMSTLPICSERKMSYSTFTIIDIDFNGQTTIVEYDNPPSLIIRDNNIFDPNWEIITLDSDKTKGKKLRKCQFKATKEDRIFFWSDGIFQSGMGSKKYPFGWGLDGVSDYILKMILHEPFASSSKLSRKIVNMAELNDGGKSKDDTSCGIIYFREPRKLLFVSGPPFNEKNDLEFSLRIQQYQGKKIISGGTTAEIIARELGLKYDNLTEQPDPDLPPISTVEGFNLVTEGIITLGKVHQILESFTPEYRFTKGPADQIVKLFLESDHIHMIIGTRINLAHQDPTMPVELELRRSVIRRICNLLEHKFLKDVILEFI
ncbi:MAG: SpoIIE family protein phosphatase [Marinilabiliaceae bacterium]|nr:SpoIIE family protein phosphatase [Marinilabiliaceae bacterium]